MKQTAAAKQVTSDELAVLSHIRKVKETGYGEIILTIHRGRVTDIKRTVSERVDIDAA